MKVLVDPNLWDHPKLYALARSLKIGKIAAAGHLISMWCYAIRYRLDGDLAGLDNSEISKAAGWEDDTGIFCAALRNPDHRWLDEFKIHDWHDHQGKYIARMMQDRERRRHYMRDYRASKGDPRPVPQPATPAPIHPVGQCATKEPLPRYKADPRFDGAAGAYPGQVDEAVARVVWERLFPTDADVAAMTEALRRENWPQNWGDDSGRYIPDFSNWLAKYGWKNRPGKPVANDVKTPY